MGSVQFALRIGFVTLDVLYAVALKAVLFNYSALVIQGKGALYPNISFRIECLQHGSIKYTVLEVVLIV